MAGENGRISSSARRVGLTIDGLCFALAACSGPTIRLRPTPTHATSARFGETTRGSECESLDNCTPTSTPHPFMRPIFKRRARLVTSGATLCSAPRPTAE